MLEILHPNMHHKIFGRRLCIDAKPRCDIEIDNRIQIAWMKYKEHRIHLTGKHVPIILRLKLFDSIIIPTLIFGFIILPLSIKHIKKLKATIQKMLRSIVGSTLMSCKHLVLRILIKMKLVHEFRECLYSQRVWVWIILLSVLRLPASLHIIVVHSIIFVILLIPPLVTYFD